MNETNLIKQYIAQLNENEKIAYEIAKEHLETSFDISKSIGFLEFKKKQLSTEAANFAYDGNLSS
tara:strand:+ start:2021 stop:2215 length:195 start_codon:yes stop_codon:yes gene_type:complete